MARRRARHPIWIALALVLLALGIVIAFRWNPGDSDCSPASGHAATGRAQVGVSLALESEDADLGRVSVSTDMDSETGPSARIPDPGPWIIRGQVVDVRGAPIRDARWSLWGLGSDSLPADDLRVAEGASGADGDLSVSTSPRADRRVRFEVFAEHHAPATWQWDITDGTLHRELGKVVLHSTAVVTCIARDRSGRLIAQSGWSVMAEQASPSLSSGRKSAQFRAVADPETGHFVLRGVPEGYLSVHLLGGAGFELGRANLFVQAGVDHIVEIAGEMPEILECIHVQVTCPPHGSISPDELSSIYASDSAGRRFPAVAPSEGLRWFTITGFQADPVTVYVQGPAFRTWELQGVSRGDFVEASLVGNVSARFRIQEPPAPAASLSTLLEVRMREPGRHPRPVVLEARPDGGSFLVEGLLPGLQDWIVRVPGRRPYRVQDLILSAGETRMVVVDERATADVTGVVRERGSGRAVVGVQVELIPTAAAGQRANSGDWDRPFASTLSGATDGSFRLEGITPGHYRLRASAGPLLQSPAVEVEVTQSTDMGGLILEMEPSGGLMGRVHGPSGSRFEGLRVLVAPLRSEHARDGRVLDLVLQDRIAAPLGTDGSFRVGPLPVGVARVVLSMPQVHLQSGSDGTMRTGGGSIDLGQVEIMAGEWKQHDFDAVAGFPGSARITVTHDGRPAWGHVLELSEDRGSHLLPRAGAVIPVDGRSIVGPLVPGLYVITVRPPEGGWIWPAPTRVLVTPGTEVEAKLDFTLVSGALSIVDSRSAPLIRAPLDLRAVTSPPLSILRRVTDTTGALRLTLPPGRYALARVGGVGPGARLDFDWPEVLSSDGELRLGD